MTSQSYDPYIIIKAADDKLVANDVQGGQTLFQSALLNWVDDARENVAGVDPEMMREAIATLWVSYAHFLTKAKQFRSTTEAYEQAVVCPVSGAVGRIWVDYARFLEDRDKLATAQQVYIRALHENGGGAVKDDQDRSLLWNEFLEMMKKRSPNLTLKELQAAIQEQDQSTINSNPTPDTLTSAPDAASAKRPRSESPMDIKSSEDTAMEEEASKTHVVTPADIDLEKTALQEITDNVQHDPGFMAAWMLRDGNEAPQSPAPLFGSSPPKLSDTTGKDLLGEEMALKLIQTLLKPSGPIILQVCRGLWMLNGLKEHQLQKSLSRLEENIKQESIQLQARLDERLSVAGAAESAVRQMNDNERQAFQNKCNQERQTLLNTMAWEQRQLLWCQQQLLTKLQIPGFQGTTVEVSELELQTRVCSYLHSSFFIHQGAGQKAHTAMLKSQEIKLKQLEVKQVGQPMKKKKSRFSPAVSTTPPPPPMGGQYQHQQVYQQYGQQPILMQQPPQNNMPGYPPQYYPPK